MPNLKDLAEDFGTDVETLRRTSNLGDTVEEDTDLTPLQEQNVRGSWQLTQQGTAPMPTQAGPPEPSGDDSAERA